MSVPQQAGLIVLAILAGAVIIVLIPYYWQAAYDSRRGRALPDEEWWESGLEDLRAQGFELLRAVRGEGWLEAVFHFQDEGRREIGRFIGRGKLSCTLLCGGRTLEGRIRGRTNRITAGDEVAAEIEQTGLLPAVFSFAYQGKTYTAKNEGLFKGNGEVREGDSLVAKFRRPRLASAKVLCACRRELPNELKTILLYLTLLG